MCLTCKLEKHAVALFAPADRQCAELHSLVTNDEGTFSIISSRKILNYRNNMLENSCDFQIVTF